MTPAEFIQKWWLELDLTMELVRLAAPGLVVLLVHLVSHFRLRTQVAYGGVDVEDKVQDRLLRHVKTRNKEWLRTWALAPSAREPLESQALHQLQRFACAADQVMATRALMVKTLKVREARRARKRQRLADDLAGASVASPEEGLRVRQLLTAAREHLSKKTIRQFELKADGYTHSEIAQRFGETKDAVQRRLHRESKRLRELLADDEDQDGDEDCRSSDAESSA